MRRVLSRSLLAGTLLLGVLALAGCGESAAEKATAEVCQARADISAQIKSLTSLTVLTISPTQVKTAFEALTRDVTKIRNAEPNLAAARKQQVDAATHTFETKLGSILDGVTSNLSLSNAEEKLKSAVSQLGESYRQTLDPIHCS